MASSRDLWTILSVIAVVIVLLVLWRKGYLNQIINWLKGLGSGSGFGPGQTPPDQYPIIGGGGLSPTGVISNPTQNASTFDTTAGQNVGHTTSGTVNVKPSGATCHGIPCGVGTGVTCGGLGCPGIGGVALARIIRT